MYLLTIDAARQGIGMDILARMIKIKMFFKMAILTIF